jgi:hypothetical protein
MRAGQPTDEMEGDNTRRQPSNKHKCRGWLDSRAYLNIYPVLYYTAAAAAAAGGGVYMDGSACYAATTVL